MIKPIFRFLVTACAAVIVLAAIVRYAPPNRKPTDHNCRMWVMVTVDPIRTLDAMVRGQLDSLRQLGWKNSDGWGLAYYLRPDTVTRLPVIRRGEPAAPLDPRYPQAIDELCKYGSDGAMAHVRKASLGLTTGIPGPHPFDRRSGVLNLRVLFAHNGAIPTVTLLDLIRQLNSNYLSKNPPDYSPNYLDSDLFCLYILENIDTYIDSTYEACIRTGITRLDSALGVNNPGYLNFVMTDGSTIWALCFAEELPKTYSLYYYPDTGLSRTWVAASEPLDKDSSFWRAIPNKTLVTLIPGQAPRFTAMDWPKTLVRERSGSDLTVDYRSVNRRVAAITFSISWPGRCRLNIFDETGRRVRNLLDAQRGAGSYVVYWNGRDDQSRDLPSGKYFCLLSVDGRSASEKIILLK
jgi:predicted glutamine amidotransferase